MALAGQPCRPLRAALLEKTGRDEEVVPAVEQRGYQKEEQDEQFRRATSLTKATPLTFGLRGHLRRDDTTGRTGIGRTRVQQRAEELDSVIGCRSADLIRASSLSAAQQVE